MIFPRIVCFDYAFYMHQPIYFIKSTLSILSLVIRIRIRNQIKKTKTKQKQKYHTYNICQIYFNLFLKEYF